MIQARNYATQVRESLMGFNFHKNDAPKAALMVEALGRATHFTLPDYGRLLDDQLGGLQDVDARLPFPQVTLEYFVPEHKLDEKHPFGISKRLIYAAELELGEAADPLTSFLGAKILTELRAQNDLAIWVVSFLGVNDMWFPCPMSFLLPCSSWRKGEGLPVGSSPQPPGDTPIRFSGVPMPIFSQTLANVFAGLGEIDVQGLCDDIGGEVRVVLEFCEALTCSNVSHMSVQTVRPQVNVRRQRAGKLPLHETRALVVRVPKRAAAPVNEHDLLPKRASPRQHLRCGHIRTYRSGEKIFVQSCTVGARERGRIDKNYVLIGA